MNTTAKVIVGIVAAAAAGVAIGMLIAPEKGDELQKKISDGARSWLSELAALIGTAKNVAEEKKNGAGPQLQESNIKTERI
ncbi:MAG TPA: YtxH domain-containing protein [Chryseolinea sp.]